jgi:hypothetical protein
VEWIVSARRLVNRYRRYLWGAFNPRGQLIMLTVDPHLGEGYGVMPALFASKKEALKQFAKGTYPGTLRRVSVKELAR